MNAGDTLAAVQRVLSTAAARWSVVGGHAANLYRDQVRTTRDVDILVGLDEPKMEGLKAALQEAGWEVQQRPQDNWLIRARHDQFGALDLMCVGCAYQQTALDRAVDQPVEGCGPVRFLAPEDVIVHKLIANRWADLADVESILLGGVELDQEYIRHWAAEWDVEDVYASVLVQAELRMQRGDDALHP